MTRTLPLALRCRGTLLAAALTMLAPSISHAGFMTVSSFRSVSAFAELQGFPPDGPFSNGTFGTGIFNDGRIDFEGSFPGPPRITSAAEQSSDLPPTGSTMSGSTGTDNKVMARYLLSSGQSGRTFSLSRFFARFQLSTAQDYDLDFNLTNIIPSQLAAVPFLDRLSLVGPMGAVVDVSTPGTFTFTGTLAPGQYDLTVDARAGGLAQASAPFVRGPVNAAMQLSWDFTFTVTPAGSGVPEPASLCLVATGLAAGVLARTARSRFGSVADVSHIGRRS